MSERVNLSRPKRKWILAWWKVGFSCCNNEHCDGQEKWRFMGWQEDRGSVHVVHCFVSLFSPPYFLISLWYAAYITLPAHDSQPLSPVPTWKIHCVAFSETNWAYKRPEWEIFHSIFCRFSAQIDVRKKKEELIKMKFFTVIVGLSLGAFGEFNIQFCIFCNNKNFVNF